jgi:hypothetical protein
VDPYRPWRTAFFAVTVLATVVTVAAAGLLLLSLG